MASNKIKGITIQIGADTLGLDSALKGIEQKSKKVTDELKDVNKTIKITGDSAAMWEQKQKLLNTALEDSKNKLKLLEEAQEQVNKQFKDKNISEEQYRAFQREVEYARSAVDKYEKELDEAKTKVKELGGASDDAAKEVDKFGDETEDAADQADKASKGGLNAIAVALGNFIYDAAKKATRELVEFGKEVVTTGMTFESSMSSVAAISGATNEELEQLTEKAKVMGATTKYTAAESADAFKYMAMAGWKTSDMISGIDGVLSLAAASGEDLATTSDIVTDAMTAFGLSADQASHFADVLAAASSNANTNVSMMGETFKYVAPVAGALNYSIEDTAEAIGLMANAGIKSTQAGTALRSIITRLSTDAGASSKSLGALGTLVEELGVQFYNADGSARDFGDVINEAREAWKGLNDEQQTEYGKAIAGTNAISGWLALMNSAPADVQKLTKAIEECDGAATDMSTTMIDNLQGDMTLLESATDGMKIALSEELNPAIRDITQTFTKYMPTVQKALEPVAKGAGKFIKGVSDAVPVILQHAAPAIEILGGALKNAYNGAKWLIEKLPGVSSFVQDVKNQKLFDTLTADAKALSDGIKQDIDKMNELRSAAREQTEVDLAKTYKTEALYTELQGLVDENGKVKKGYEDRANFIINELQEATGVEIEQIDGVIQEYDKLQAKIEETIQKQKAQIFEKNYAEMYSEALRQNSQAASNLYQAQTARDQSVQELSDWNKKVDSWFQQGGKFYNSPKKREWYGSISMDNFSETLDKWKQGGIINDLQETELMAIQDKYSTNSDSLAKERFAVAQNNHIIEYYEKAEEALAAGNYSLAQGYFAEIDHASAASFNLTSENIDEAVEEGKKAVDEVAGKLRQATKEEIRNGDIAIKAEITELVNTMVAQGIQGADAVKTGIIDKLGEIDGFDTTLINQFMIQLGIELGDILDDSLRNRLLYLRNDLINEYSINSQSDYEYWKQHWQDTDASRDYFSSLGWHASGGFIGIGNEGIVAEAGPELLQVMNGGVKVTPLNRTATNTPVGAGGDTIINNYYNSVQATVGSRYDVYKMAEDLDTAERRVKQGRGR